MARQGSLKVGGAADTIREVGLAEVCEHALEMEMSDGGFQEQSFPGTSWGEVSPLLSISQHGHTPEPFSRSALEKNPRPGPLFEGNPVGEGTTRREKKKIIINLLLAVSGHHCGNAAGFSLAVVPRCSCLLHCVYVPQLSYPFIC